MASPANIKKAKENRFTLSSRILADEGIRVEVIDNPREMPASYNIKTKVLQLNEACPKATGVEALLYDRGKLFHELGHALYTSDKDDMRGKLCDKSHNPQAFLNVSNVLEDGRIERLMCENFQGAKDYLDALLLKELEIMTPEPLNGLGLNVRTKLFRNKAEEKMFAPYLKAIDTAVACDSTKQVCEIAFAIVESLYPPVPKQPEGQGQDKGQGEGQQSESQSGKGKPQKGQGESLNAGEGQAQDTQQDKEAKTKVKPMKVKPMKVKVPMKAKARAKGKVQVNAARRTTTCLALRPMKYWPRFMQSLNKHARKWMKKRRTITRPFSRKRKK